MISEMIVTFSNKNLQDLFKKEEEAKIIQINNNNVTIFEPKIIDIINYINKENKFFINNLKKYNIN